MRVGIIQGRLSEPTLGFQECPEDWKREFELLSKLNLNHIEWIITSQRFEANPAFHEDISSYPISSLCADNLVDARITDKEFLNKNLRPICEAALKNNIKQVAIPLLEDSTVENESTRKAFCDEIQEYAEEYKKINFLFEAELDAENLLKIVNLSERFFITYDTGNITSCGFSHKDYLPKVYEKIKNVHLKDRTFDAKTVEPTQGDTNFKEIFNFLKEKGYNKHYTLQTARGITGQELETVIDHKRILEEIYNEQCI